MKLVIITLLSLFLPAAYSAILTIATISDNPSKVFKSYQPVADYLTRRLLDENATRVKVAALSTEQEMISALINGNVDLYVDSPFTALRISQASQSEIFLRRWKKGQAEYKSVIFVRKDSGIKNLSELTGKTIVFEEEFSTSSYLLPKTSMQAMGFSLMPIGNKSEVAPNSIFYTFSFDDENTVFWVLKNKFHGGAMSAKSFYDIAGGKATRLQIIFESILVPRHVVSHRRGIDNKLLDKVTQILLNMENDSEGKKVLAEFSKTKRFDELPGGNRNYLKPLLQLMARETN